MSYEEDEPIVTPIDLLAGFIERSLIKCAKLTALAFILAIFADAIFGTFDGAITGIIKGIAQGMVLVDN